MTIDLRCGDALALLREMPEASVQTCVTSPPYWGLRDYGTAKWEGGDAACDHKATVARHDGGRSQVDGFHGSLAADSDKGAMNHRGQCPKCGARRIDAQLGLERTPQEYVAGLVEVFREVRRVLRDDGTLWLNLGDSFSGGGNNRGGNPSERSYKQKTNRGGYGQIATPIADGLKPKDMVGIPWRVAFALQADGWWLRSDIIWAKPNPMPESVTDRPTKSHEYLFLLTKSARYYYDAKAIAEPCESGPSDLKKMEESLPRIGGKHKTLVDPLSKASSTTNIGQKRAVGGRWPGIGPQHATERDRNEKYEPMETHPTRNARSVWTIATAPYPEAHFATFPPELPRRCILAGSKPGDTVLDPFAGAGTTGLVADRLGRSFIGLELNPKYVDLAQRRIENDAPLFNREEP